MSIYVRRNAHTIPNYAERHRYGERVATAFAESTVNAVVGKRFTKRQQMRWSRRGAHLMLQTRTRVLDDTLRAKFQSWYPDLFNVRTQIAQNTTSLLDPTVFDASCLGAHNGAACSLKRRHLGIEVLVRGRDPGIADTCSGLRSSPFLAHII